MRDPLRVPLGAALKAAIRAFRVYLGSLEGSTIGFYEGSPYGLLLTILLRGWGVL